MTASYQSPGSQIYMLILELQITQPKLYLFLEDFISVRRTCRDRSKVFYAALMPHFKEPGCEIRTEINESAVDAVRQEFNLFDSKVDDDSLRRLTAKLQERKMYQTGHRRWMNDQHIQDFAKTPAEGWPLSPIDKRNAELLFLAIWEMEARALESQGQRLTP